MPETTTLTLPTEEELEDVNLLLQEAYDQVEQIVSRIADVTTKDEPPPVTLADVGRLLSFAYNARETNVGQILERLEDIEKATLLDLAALARFGELQGVPVLAEE